MQLTQTFQSFSFLPPFDIIINSFALEIKIKTSKGIILPWRLSYWHFLVIPFHNLLKIDTFRKDNDKKYLRETKKPMDI